MVDDGLVNGWWAHYLLGNCPRPLPVSAEDALANYVYNGHARYTHRIRGGWEIRDDVWDLVQADAGRFEHVTLCIPNNCTHCWYTSLCVSIDPYSCRGVSSGAR